MPVFRNLSFMSLMGARPSLRVSTPIVTTTHRLTSRSRGDASDGQREARNIAAHTIDRAAFLARAAPRAGHDVEVAQVVAAEADARDHGTRHGYVAAVA